MKREEPYMDTYYTSEINVQMLVFLMKAHGIKKVVVSPGTTNITFVASIQQDEYFELISAADERSAAYIACGIAAESHEPVAISCTGATASRNYIPGLTEAYYRNLPILAITSTQHSGRIGQLMAQVIDRSTVQNDIVVKSVYVPLCHTDEDKWACNIKLNTALLELRRKCNGPVHINIETDYNNDFSIKTLPDYRVIRRVSFSDFFNFPDIKSSKVCIFVGAHLSWSEELTKEVDLFCEKYNGAVYCDNTSNYHGKYRVQYNLISAQQHFFESNSPELLIDIGQVSGAYMEISPKKVWRISLDGEVRDRFRTLEYVFEMDELSFFSEYNKKGKGYNISYYDECKNEYDMVYNKIDSNIIPFSNIWIASKTVSHVPDSSIIHFGILNSLRSWNFFSLPNSIDCYSNTGGFGIDGVMSTLLGGALTNKEKIHYLVIGDLAFFYDMNSIANRYLCNNIRILLINNGCGTEFKNYNHFASKFRDDADPYIAAKGHYGNKSSELIKHYATDLGFVYISAKNKKEYLDKMYEFVDNKIEKPILFEVFTNDVEESDALKYIRTLIVDSPKGMDKVKKIAKSVLGEKRIDNIKKVIRR